jgi:hypothetical protein
LWKNRFRRISPLDFIGLFGRENVSIELFHKLVGVSGTTWGAGRPVGGKNKGMSPISRTRRNWLRLGQATPVAYRVSLTAEGESIRQRLDVCPREVVAFEQQGLLAMARALVGALVALAAASI